MQTATSAQDRPLTFYSNPRHGQDRWVIEDVLQGKRDGYFVEAGAGGLSNTYALESQFGWTGLAVEPHPGRFEEIRAKRRCALENVCLTDAAGEVEFVINHTAPWSSGIRGAVGEELERTHYRGGAVTETVRVRGCPLWELLRQHGAPRRIDYLSLDVEGAEWMVLKDFPFDEYSFACMTIERGADDYLRLRAKLLRESYRLVRVGRADDFWVHRDAGYRAPLRDLLNVALRRVVQPIKGRFRSCRRARKPQ
jgi:FkbM family methyltransferase